MRITLKEMENEIMIRNYFKMKKNEWKIKAMIYGTIADIIDNQKVFVELLQKLYFALKDVPTEELQNELINKLAEIIHKENTEQSN